MIIKLIIKSDICMHKTKKEKKGKILEQGGSRRLLEGQQYE